MPETNPIIKQVQLDLNTHEIGAKYDNIDEEHSIYESYGNSLSLSDGKLDLIAKDEETILSTIALSTILYVENNNDVYNLKESSDAVENLTQEEVIELIETAIGVNHMVLMSCEGILARLSYRNEESNAYSYGFIGSDEEGRLYQFYLNELTEVSTEAEITKMPLFAAADFTKGMYGVLDIAHGGTNNDTLTVNGVLVGNSETDQQTNITTDFVDYVSDTLGTGGAFYAPADSAPTGKVAQRPLFGTLPVAYGGTGAQSFTTNQLLVGNDTSAVTTIPAASTNGDYVLKNTIANNTVAVPVWTKLVSSDIPAGDIEIDSFKATTPLSVSKGGTGSTSLSSITVGTATRAIQDESGNNIKNSYGASLSFDSNILVLKNMNGQTLSNGSITFNNATYSNSGLMSADDKIKLDGFYVANAYATVDYVNDLIAANDAMVYKGIVDSHNTLPLNPQNGWAYKVGEAGTYAGQACQVGDILMYSSASSTWQRVPSSVEGALYKINPFTAGQMLISSGTQGAVMTMPIAPSVSFDAATENVGQTIKVTVGGEQGSASNPLTQARINVYGVTKLSNITTNEDKSSQTLAATPVGVYNAIEDALDGINTTPSYEDYTLLPESSQETTNSTTFKWSGNSITITSPDITADSYEFVVIPPLTSAPNAATAALKQREISALNQAMIVASEQARPADAQAGYITLTALGDVPTITTHIRIIHKYNTDDMTRSATTAAAHEFAAQGYALQAQSSVHGVKKKSVVITTTTDNTNQRYPNKAIVSMAGVTEGDWVDGSGIYDQDWTIESGTDQVILHFSKALTNAAVTIYWASCQNFDDYLGGE